MQITSSASCAQARRCAVRESLACYTNTSHTHIEPQTHTQSTHISIVVGREQKIKRARLLKTHTQHTRCAASEVVRRWICTNGLFPCRIVNTSPCQMMCFITLVVCTFWKYCSKLAFIWRLNFEPQNKELSYIFFWSILVFRIIYVLKCMDCTLCLSVFMIVNVWLISFSHATRSSAMLFYGTVLLFDWS